jgi:hypothetical protein
VLAACTTEDCKREGAWIMPLNFSHCTNGTRHVLVGKGKHVVKHDSTVASTFKRLAVSGGFRRCAVHGE